MGEWGFLSLPSFILSASTQPAPLRNHEFESFFLDPEDSHNMVTFCFSFCACKCGVILSLRLAQYAIFNLI